MIDQLIKYTSFFFAKGILQQKNQQRGQKNRHKRPYTVRRYWSNILGSFGTSVKGAIEILIDKGISSSMNQYCYWEIINGELVRIHASSFTTCSRNRMIKNSQAFAAKATFSYIIYLNQSKSYKSTKQQCKPNIRYEN